MDSGLVFIIGLWVVCAIAGGLITQSKGASFVSGFILGIVLGVLGLIIACFTKGPRVLAPPPQPPGWYADPWNPTHARYYDGREWTWHTYEGAR